MSLPASKPLSESPAPGKVLAALKLFLVILAALFVFEWGFALINTYVTHRPYPYTTPFNSPVYHFSDWLNYIPHAAHFRQPHFLIREGPGLGLAFAYPIPCIYVYLLFYKLAPVHNLLAYIVFTILAFTLVTLGFSLYLRRIRAPFLFQLCTWAALLLGFPAVFLLERGNFEVFVWLLVVGALTAFLKDRKYLAAFLFACAACTKIYPALFFLLFVPRRQYLPILFGVCSAILIFVVALFGAGTPVSSTLHDISSISKILHDVPIIHVAEGNLRWDHSLLSEPKAVIYSADRAFHLIKKDDDPAFPRMVRVYGILAPLFFLALYVFRIRRLPLLNQFAALTLCSVLLPYISYEYTLVAILLVWAVFLVFLFQDVFRPESHPVPITYPQLRNFAILFALTLAPMTAAAFEHYPGQVKGIVLVLLLIAFVRVPLPSTVFGDLPSIASSDPEPQALEV